MENVIVERLRNLRGKMKEEKIDVYIVPSSDPHLSEYYADRFKCREYITGFTGSAGTAVVTQDEAGLFTDGRYFIQAEKELDGSGIDLYKMKEPGVPTLNKWLESKLSDGMTLGYDGRLFSHNQLKEMKEDLKYNKIDYVDDKDLVDRIWDVRPGMPDSRVFIHDIKYTGIDTGEKIGKVREEMKSKKADVYLMNSLGSIAWLFNIRSHDVKYTPVAYAYGFIDDNGARLYIDKDKLDVNDLVYLREQGVDIRDYDRYFDDLKLVENSRIYYDPDMSNGLMTASLDDSNTLIDGKDIVFMMKGCLSDAEEKNLKSCQIRDGVAMVSFLCWFDKAVAEGGLYEGEAAEKLEDFRADQELFIEPSFETISAYGENAALMHYSVDEKNPVEIGNRGLYLLDSGGQYYDGTTDITRTVAVGELTDEERKDFTLVLKSHIAMAKAVFLQGSTGSNLDAIARQPIWNEYMDYKCGTGHGVAYVGSVHEGPVRLSMNHQSVVIKPGMVVTNEPGIYKEGKHGIRLENTLLVKEKATNDMGTFLDFETISFCPLDLRCIERDMLTDDEVKWLNDYHKKVYDLLSLSLGEDERAWLENATMQI
ncbi:Xaa-Pro aminopeptidase [Dethiosulfatibacter aminovorans DSM 17477]|uniref:Xaa-Pro aminopeptidase n=1 Tax=Dethiosulfatibacter aminovorans DSM 17477 TaxID=1121476 RepID=A0A1M6KMQ5_9FIRM|nr:aminopeptidase P family protein [Dethiosulfatibacter aminovorans]SHJ60176.1 Xaa-Pro aminopeptidase [Dethiosulfatibacter aminovorans DSM 17477]